MDSSEMVDEIASETTEGIFKFLSDYKIFIIFGLSIIICFVIVLFIFYKKQEPCDEQATNNMEEYKKQNTELIKQNNILAKQLQFVQEKQKEHIPPTSKVAEPKPKPELEPEPKKKRIRERTANNETPNEHIETIRSGPTSEEINKYAQSIKKQFMQVVDDVEIVNDDYTDQSNERNLQTQEDDIVEEESDSELNIDIDDILYSV